MAEERLIAEDGRLVKQGFLGISAAAVTWGLVALAAAGDLTLNRRAHDLVDSTKKKQWGRLGKNVGGFALNTIPVSLLKYLKFFKHGKHGKHAARALNAWEGTAGAGSAAGLTALGASKRAQHNYEKGKEPGLSEKAIAPLVTASSWLLKADPGYLYDTGLGPVKGMDSVNEKERFKNLRDWMKDQNPEDLYNWGNQALETGKYSKGIPGSFRTTWKRNPERANRLADATLARKHNEARLQALAAQRNQPSTQATTQSTQTTDSSIPNREGGSGKPARNSTSYRSSPAFPSPRRSLHNRYMT